MRPRDILLALLVVFILGVSFVPIKFGLQVTSPFALCAWRFFLAAVPLVFFVPRPNVPWRVLFGYGFMIGVVQFGLLFFALSTGMPAGLSSLIIQAQVFFTIGFSVLWLGERVGPAQLAGAVLALAGLIIIGWAKMSSGLGLGFAMVLGAALAWALGNIIAKRAGRVDLLGFIAWSSLAAPIPLALLSLAFEGPTALVEPLLHPTVKAWGAILTVAYGATVFGFGMWSKLLVRYGAAVVSPFALLIPVAGMASTALVFGERLTKTQAVGALLVILGLTFTVLGPKLITILRNRSR